MKSNRFYLACLRDTVGTNMAFHGSDGGYPTDLDKARTYTREEAQRAWNGGREIDLPICADRVDAFGVFHVDMQRIPCDTEVVDGCTEYVAFKRGAWNGNDVFWVTESGDRTTDFSQAAIFATAGDESHLVYIPFAMADAVKRRTFDIEHLDRRRMIQAAGLITPDHIKRYRRRGSGSGKVRFNCDGCGRMHWQHNPHEFDGCKNVDCELYNEWVA